MYLAASSRYSFWVSVNKCDSYFWPLRAKKWPKRPFWGNQRQKLNQRQRRHRNNGHFTRWNFSDPFIDAPAMTHFLQKIRFHPPTSSYSLGGRGANVPFRYNSLRRSTPAGPKARRGPTGPFGPLGQPARFAHRLDNTRQIICY